MKSLYIITGTGKGLGKALAEVVLSEGAMVLGISRTKSIEHDNYQHITLDLNNVEKVSGFALPADVNEYEKVVLVNNAGILGDINHVGKLNNDTIAQTFTVNTIAPAILMNNFMRQYKGFKGEKIVLNISSGAGKVAIDGWSAYCASKAAVDMFTQVAAKEIAIDGLDFKVFALSPGIIDTNMQEQIRQADKEGFSEVERFKEYKANNELQSAEETAQKIYWFLQNTAQFNDVIVSVRDF
ncbi:MAG TPA: short-chain dehydrogenase [Flavobacteriales bacterium]|nr:short-chain dehydrogenase [Flavobacteriales bacterium]|tara:strand:+ start:112054 stop:112773 length:720 start_codon:yes stop_codon:yes gene_type:complete